MDIIYSRRRIKFPHINKNGKYNNKDILKAIQIFIIITIAALVVRSSINIIVPIFETQCNNKIKSIVTIISNNKSTEVMRNYTYTDLMTIYKNEQGEVTMISANIIPINEIISDIPVKIQEELNRQENSKFNIKLGSVIGSRILSGRGPSIAVKISHVGNIETDLKSEFTAMGINQTRHRIYLDLKCNMQALTPYKIVESEIINQVLLIENIIVGTTPETFYDLEGLNREDNLNLIQ